MVLLFWPGGKRVCGRCCKSPSDPILDKQTDKHSDRRTDRHTGRQVDDDLE